MWSPIPGLQRKVNLFHNDATQTGDWLKLTSKQGNWVARVSNTNGSILNFPGQPTKAKEPTKEEQMKMLIDQVGHFYHYMIANHVFASNIWFKETADWSEHLSDHIIISNQLGQRNIGSLPTSLVQVHGYEERIAQLEQGGHIFK